jgi:hypothetical protein
MPMTESEWLACADPEPMLEFLRGKASDRKVRLFAVSSFRRVPAILGSEGCQAAFEVAERFAEGSASESELPRLDAAGFCWDAPMPIRMLQTFVMVNSHTAAFSAVAWATGQKRTFVGRTQYSHPQELPTHAALLRDVIPNPFKPSPPLPAAVLAWHDRTVPRLALGIYEGRKMPEGTLDNARLAVLADALLDAGCEDEALIAHCREAGTHVRGCWAVDLLLGKE